jgi:hypothetical protein
MTSKFIEIGSGQNLLPTIKEADLADNLFIGGKGECMQWSVSKGKVIKQYGNMKAGAIFSMVQTSSKNYLFVSDWNGC